MRRLLCYVLAFLELRYVRLLGRVFGISLVVRYMRNPNPEVVVKLLRAFGASIGSRTTIKRSLILDNTFEDENSAKDFSHLKIGDNCYIGDCVFLDLANEIVIGDNAVVSAQVSFLTHADCNRSNMLSGKFPRQCEPIFVGRGAWLGFGATLFPGVHVGDGSVVGAKSLLLQDAEDHSVYLGTPARKTQQLDCGPVEPVTEKSSRFND